MAVEETQPVEGEEVETTQEQIVEEEKEFVNPQARARYLERENKRMADQLSELTEALRAAARRPEEVEQPEFIEDVSEDEWASDPLGVLRKEIQDIKRKQLENEQRSSYQNTVQTVAGALKEANNLIIAGVRSDKERYESALVHLFQVIDGEVEEESPSYTERQRHAEVVRRVDLMKLSAMQSNKHPLDVLVSKAKRFGWKDDFAKKEDGDAKETIRAAKKRDEGSRTISTSDGGTPKARMDFTKMTNAERNKAMDEALKSGRFKRDGSSIKSPPLRDILPANKLIPINRGG